MPYSDFGYNDPLHIVWRKGTPEDPYIDKAEYLKVVNQTIVLSEIPDRFYRVRITGLKEVNVERITNKTLAPDEFVVDYSTGVIQLHQEQEGKTLNIFYKGRGFIQYPSNRIYHQDKFNNVVKSLSQIIDDSNEVILEANNRIKQIEDLLVEAEIKINETETVIDNANKTIVETELAKNKALNAYETTRLVFKPYVNKFSDIAVQYPNPEIGWTVQVYETGIRYRYDGIDWIPIDLFGGAVPLASETLDGLMSKDDYKKLKSLPVELKDRVLVFVLPSYLSNGIQGVIARFPFNGTIVSVKAFCGTTGLTDTFINVEKSIDLQTWTSVLASDLTIPAGSYFDNNSHSISNTTVQQGEFFRINVLQSGDGIKDVTVEVIIKI
jgi:hypothetical protein